MTFTSSAGGHAQGWDCSRSEVDRLRRAGTPVRPGQVFVHPHAWYADHDVDLWLGQAVIGINRVGHDITLNDSTHLGYETSGDRVLAASAARARRQRRRGALPAPA